MDEKVTSYHQKIMRNNEQKVTSNEQKVTSNEQKVTRKKPNRPKTSARCIITVLSRQQDILRRYFQVALKTDFLQI